MKSANSAQRMRRAHLLIAGALASIAGTALAQVPAKVLKVAPSADVQELDPTRGRNLISRIYSQMVFDTLFALGSAT